MCEMPLDARVPRDAALDAPGPDADTTPPMVFATVPTNGTIDVARTATITVTYDEAVMGVTTTSFAVSSSGSSITGTITAQSTATYVFTPDSMLPANATIDVLLTSAITDAAGNGLAHAFSFDTAP